MTKVLKNTIQKTVYSTNDADKTGQPPSGKGRRSISFTLHKNEVELNHRPEFKP